MTQQAGITINVYGEPPTKEAIAVARTHAQRGDDREAVASKVLMYCPIPVLDVVAAAATYAVMTATKDDPLEPLRDVPDAVEDDWSGSDATKAYVARVRSQGRHLVQIEVAALEDHLITVARAAGLADHVNYAVNLAKELASKAGEAFTGSK